MRAKPGWSTPGSHRTRISHPEAGGEWPTVRLHCHTVRNVPGTPPMGTTPKYAVLPRPPAVAKVIVMARLNECN
ncbi:unnamed protein product [Ectocarpus sp. CCAP 1310/34]|nr:unnamed protein product [Ectocarpus sp. CCAP 1310/34]